MARTFLVLFVLATWVGAAAPRTPLRADRQSQAIQNQRADQDHLGRFTTTEALQRYVRLKLMAPVPSRTKHYYLHKIPSPYRYLRPWAKLFLDRLGSQFRARFGRPLRVTSLVRTAAYQKRLRRVNHNAASASGNKRSAHLTGASLDISKKGTTRAEQSWLRRVLAHVHRQNYLYAIEEFSQPNFHVMVYKNYPEYVTKLEAKKNGARHAD